MAVIGNTAKGIININYKIIIEALCYGPSVISVIVTKGEHPRGSGLHRTSGTMGRGVSRVI